MMAEQKTEAVRFLRSTIFRYSNQLHQLRCGASPSAEVVVERTRVRVSESDLVALIDDAQMLLSQLA